jgi:transglutaminase-like putative cysteine protease
MGSKTLALVAVAILVVAAFFILDTSSLLQPFLDKLSIHEPEATPQAVLWVNGYLDKANSPNGFYTIAYSVTNLGNTTAQNVTLTTAVNGETRSSKLIPTLEESGSANDSITISATPDTLYVASVQASCEDSADSYTFSFGADVPRTFSDNPDQVKLFITPREPTIIALKNELLKDAPLKMKDWIALRNWVGDNIQYKHDNEVYGVPEYWQFGKETISLKTGDCEDFAILLCSLLRSAGYSPNDVYVVIGQNANGYHAWVKINLETLGWYNLEPQENGFATIVGDFLTLSDYHALYEFNDQQFHQN